MISMTDYIALDDQELLDLLKSGDVPAFDTIYHRYWSLLYQHAYYILKDKETCNDAIQDVFVWLWQHREEVQAVSLKSYLKAAVRFKIANYIRAGKIRDSFFDELQGREPGSTIIDELAVKELKAVISQAEGTLPEKCREIYNLSRYEHLSNAEIALRLNISVKTVENQMTIALKRIRSYIKGHLIMICLLASLFK